MRYFTCKVLLDEVTVGQKLCAGSQQVSQRHAEGCPRQRGTVCAGGPPRGLGELGEAWGGSQ